MLCPFKVVCPGCPLPWLESVGHTVVSTRCPGGGGGVLGLEKGTDCGPTTAKRWLSQPKMAKKGRLSSYYIV